MKFTFLKNVSTPVVRYNDHAIRIVLSLIAAHIMVLYNDHENFFEAMFTRSYLRGLAAGFVIAYVVTYYVYRVTIWLDKRYDWHANTFVRFFWQCCIGFFAPAILVFLLVAAFMVLYQINIFDTHYLRQDYPLALLMLLSFNLYYFGLYFYIKYVDYISANQLNPESGLTPFSHLDNALLLESEPLGPESTKEQPRHKEVILVETVTQTLRVLTDDIAYIFILEGNTFLRLKDMSSLDQSYQTDYSLKELETLLDPSKFFRINRQVIIHYDCVVSFRVETAKTLLLSVDPEPYPTEKNIPAEHQKLLVVSEIRTPRFKAWMDR